MARARNIKPGFYQNEDLAECSVWARYIFPGLWMMADREGRLEYRPKKIKGELLRFDNQDAEPLLKELQRYGFIVIYEVAGRELIQIVNFSKHQNPHHREAESELPPIPSPGLTRVGNSAKPGATDSSDDAEAQGEPEASPGMEVEDTTCQGGPAVLIPDSGFSDSLIPDSGSPQGSVIASGASARTARDDQTIPKTPAEWCRYFADEHGIELNASNVHHRNKAWPLFTAWIKAGISIGQMDRACTKARAEAKGSIAFLPAYADSVLASMDAPQRRPSREQQIREISEANGAAWLAQSGVSDPTIIDMEQ